jgi:hypothetical protein
MIAFGASSIGFLMYNNFGDQLYHTFGSIYEALPWLSKGAVLAFVASFGMWCGFSSKTGKKFSALISRNRFTRSLFSHSYQPRWGVVFCLYAIGIVTNIIGLRSGISGAWKVESFTAFLSYIRLLESSVYIGIILLTHHFYKDNSVKRLLVLLISIIIPSGLGFIGGMKHEILYPSFVSVITYSIVAKKVPARAFFVLLFIVYFVFLSASIYRLSQSIGSNDSISLNSASSAMYNTITGQAKLSKYIPDRKASVSRRVLSRLNRLPQVSSMLWAEKNAPKQMSESPNFLYKQLLSPVLAVIPRLIWPSKPKKYAGGWAYSTVTGRHGPGTSMGVTPIFTLYYSGGIVACLVGFFLIGIVQRSIFELVIRYGLPSLIVYFMVLPVLVRLPDVYYTLIVQFIRLTPIALLVQYVVFNK